MRDGKLVAVKRTKEKYEGVRDRLQKLEEVLRVFKISRKSKEEPDCEGGVIQVLECWEEGGYLYMCSELCARGNLNDYLL